MLQAHPNLVPRRAELGVEDKTELSRRIRIKTEAMQSQGVTFLATTRFDELMEGRDIVIFR
jgi:hypothetical protein